ncbi:hypothetical protein JZ751_016898 [Albula glossodonta]|uniref:Uncharacterized protein n=1 Tax=Albula glossodonta TaxID=121402 RepID=A0A8T2MTZ6_9TELE|nr:hypothetical protein JZ751_016898 [Albula glossodonta]
MSSTLKDIRSKAFDKQLTPTICLRIWRIVGVLFPVGELSWVEGVATDQRCNLDACASDSGTGGGTELRW